MVSRSAPGVPDELLGAAIVDFDDVEMFTHVVHRRVPCQRVLRRPRRSGSRRRPRAGDEVDRGHVVTSGVDVALQNVVQPVEIVGGALHSAACRSDVEAPTVVGIWSQGLFV